MDFERKFWDEQTPLTPEELNRIERGIGRVKIYRGQLTLNNWSINPNEIQTYTISCPGARVGHISLVSWTFTAGFDVLAIKSRSKHDEVEVLIENLSDYGFDTSIPVTIRVVALDFFVLQN